MHPRKLIFLLLIINLLTAGLVLGLKRVFAKEDVPIHASQAPVAQPKPTLFDLQNRVANRQEKPADNLPRVVAQTPKEPERYVTGILRKGSRFIAVLSDGSTITEQDNIPARMEGVPGAGEERLSYATRNFIIYDKQRLYLKPRLDTAGSPGMVGGIKLPHGNTTNPKTHEQETQSQEDG